MWVCVCVIPFQSFSCVWAVSWGVLTLKNSRQEPGLARQPVGRYGAWCTSLASSLILAVHREVEGEKGPRKWSSNVRSAHGRIRALYSIVIKLRETKSKLYSNGDSTSDCDRLWFGFWDYLKLPRLPSQRWPPAPALLASSNSGSVGIQNLFLPDKSLVLLALFCWRLTDFRLTSCSFHICRKFSSESGF